MIHTALPKQTFPGIIITFVRGSNGDPGNLNYNPYAARLTVWNPAQLSRGLIRTERQNASDRFCPSPFETDEIWASRTDSAMFLSPLLQMPLSPFCPPPIWWAEPIVLENSLVVELHMQDSAAKRNFLSTYVVMWYCGFINEKKIGLRFLVTSWIPFCGHPGRHLGDNPKNQQTRYDVGLFTSHYQSNFGVWFWSTPNSTIQKTLPPSLWPASTWSVRSSTVPVRRPAGDPEVPLSRKILSVR